VGRRLSLYGLVIVGAKSNALHSTHSTLAFSVDCSLLLHAFFPFFARFFNHCTLTLNLTLCPPSRISLFFLGIALYIKTCLEPHRIRTTHVPSTGLVSFLSSHYSPSFFLFACLTLCPFGGLLLVLLGMGGALSCLVLASCCLVLPRSKLIDRPFPSRSHRLLSIFSFLSLFHFFSFVSLVSYSSTSKRRASLSHTCTITKFDHSI
jgi:hypothetical protein